jgi:glycosyltransferase involved in cell wall biosynthesis
LKIAINAAAAKMGGAVNYLTNFLRHLPPSASGDQNFVFLPAETSNRLIDIPPNIRLCPHPGENVGGWRRIWWEQVKLRRFLVKEKVDVLFSTANFGMYRCPVKQILLVRNTLYFSKPYQQLFLPRHSLKKRIAFRLRRWLICLSVRSADIVMTPTQAMLDELRDFVDVPSHKALVNPYGVESASPSPGAPPVQSETGRSDPGHLCKLLYVSLYAEHKNLNTLLKAIPLLNENGAGKFLLQTTADPTWEGAAWTVTHQEDIDLTKEPGISPWVRLLRPLPRERMEQLYLDSDIFVFPSLTESFGFPMAEAMSYGLPIVAADTPVNREICGEAAVYFRPLDPADLARQVRRVATDQAVRQPLQIEGRRRAATMCRWDEHVRRVLAAASVP